jgi:hypothetical protein
MPDFDFEAFLDTVGEKLTTIAGEISGEFRDAAITDGKAFIEASRESLKRWTLRLATGELSPEDFGDLLEGEKDLAEMATLKQTVMAKMQINNFKDALIGVIKETVAEQLGGGG